MKSEICEFCNFDKRIVCACSSKPKSDYSGSDTLSDKIQGVDKTHIGVNDVKEFIKRLKEEIELWKKDVLETEHQQNRKYTDGALIAISNIQEKIDKLSGKELSDG